MSYSGYALRNENGKFLYINGIRYTKAIKDCESILRIPDGMGSVICPGIPAESTTFTLAPGNMRLSGLGDPGAIPIQAVWVGHFIHNRNDEILCEGKTTYGKGTLV